MKTKAKSKFVGLEHMAARVQNSHESRRKNITKKKGQKKKPINPITGKLD